MTKILNWKILIAFLGLACLSSTGWAKPLPPMSVTISSSQVATAGTVFDFSVTVQPRTDLERLEIAVELPAGVELVRGQLSQVVKAAAGKSISVDYSVQLPSALGGAIVARARVGAATEVLFAVSSRYELSASRRKAQSLDPPSTTYKRSVRDGQPVREYSLP